MPCGSVHAATDNSALDPQEQLCITVWRSEAATGCAGHSGVAMLQPFDTPLAAECIDSLWIKTPDESC